MSTKQFAVLFLLATAWATGPAGRLEAQATGPADPAGSPPAAAATAGGPSPAAGGPSPRAPLSVPRVSSAPRIDGIIDEVAWQGAALLEEWVQTKPGDNTRPTGRTTARILHDDEALYIAVRAEGAPGAVRYALHPRDGVPNYGQDWIGLRIDTFNDGRRAFVFGVNPLGIQGDAILREGGEFTEWDAVFESFGRVDPDRGGYTIEIRIPFRSLRYPVAGDRQVWGVGIIRTYGASGEEDTPWPLSRDLGCDLCQLRQIALDGRLEPAGRIEINPTLVGLGSAIRAGGATALGDFDARLEPGLNLKYGVTPELTLDVTLNPDFSQVESDAGQIDVNSRFALFFPERRPFFLEGGDLFSTVVPLPGTSPWVQRPINVFHSRTILEPDWGVKVSGKQGRLGLGLLATRDGFASGPVDAAADVGVARATFDVLGDGFVGAILTTREENGLRQSVAAIDTRFRLNGNATVRGIAAASTTPGALPGDPSRTGEALQLQLDYRDRVWQAGVGFLDITGDFEADVGFVPRTDQVTFTGSVSRLWRRTGFVQRVQPSVRYERIHEHGDGGRMLSVGDLADEIREFSLGFDFPRATQFGGSLSQVHTRFRGREFPGLVRGGSRLFTEATSWLGLELLGRTGEDIIYADRTAGNATRPARFVQGTLTARLRPLPGLRLAVAGQGSRIHRLGENGAADTRYAEALIPRLTTEFQVSRRLGFRGIAELRRERYFDGADDLFSRDTRVYSDFLASYVLGAGSALYFGWSDLRTGNLQRDLSPERRGGSAKATYLLRF